MNLDSRARRRWLGAAALLAALAMLVLGETILKNALSNYAFLGYWAVCLTFTVAAIIVAFKDARAVQRTVGREHRDLLESTLHKIEGDARSRKGPQH